LVRAGLRKVVEFECKRVESNAGRGPGSNLGKKAAKAGGGSCGSTGNGKNV